MLTGHITGLTEGGWMVRFPSAFALTLSGDPADRHLRTFYSGDAQRGLRPCCANYIQITSFLVKYISGMAFRAVCSIPGAVNSFPLMRSQSPISSSLCCMMTGMRPSAVDQYQATGCLLKIPCLPKINQCLGCHILSRSSIRL